MKLEQYRQQFNEDDAVGWECIDRHLEAVYGAQEPRHYAPALRWRLGGDNPLDGCSIYDHPAPRNTRSARKEAPSTGIS